MGFLDRILIHGAEAIRTTCATLGDGVTAVLGIIDAALNPILSPVLSALNPIFTALGDGVYAVLQPFGAVVGLTLISAITGVLALVAFRLVSNQEGIARALDTIKANLLALKLYRDELRVTFQCQARLFAAIARLQWHMLPPFVVMLIPTVPVLAQMGLRHQWRPLQPGERTLIKVTADPGVNHPSIEWEPNPAVVMEIPGIFGDGQWIGRVRAVEPGRHLLRFRVPGETLEKEFVVGSLFERVSAIRTEPDWTTQLLHPVEPRIPADSPVRSIEIVYPGVESPIYGSDYWVLFFFVISMATALLLRPLFKVRF